MSFDAWELTRRISPRPWVQAAQRDVAGIIANKYPSRRNLSQPEPDVPWAIMLTETDRRYRLLGFDFDTSARDADPQGDADRLVQLCARLGIATVTCASDTGSTRRHVWIGLAETVAAATVAQLARTAAAWLPSLDIAPLTNPSTGAMRPPGSPHRSGGASIVLAGDVHTLARPAVTRSRLGQLHAAVDAELQTYRPKLSLVAGRSAPASAAVDATGRRCLPRRPGRRGKLPDASLAALTEAVPPAADASTQMWVALLGCVRAGWSHADVAALLGSAPGLEHARTRRNGPHSRQHRPDQEQQRILAADWDRAVDQVTKDHPSTTATDPDLARRAAETDAAIRAIQERADAMPGRWKQPSGASHRRILDVICLLACRAMTRTLELPTRYLALTGGVGRETARRALHALAADGWISRSRDHTGQKAATWKIHSPVDQQRSQVDTPPAHPPQYRQRLDRRLHLARHDVFLSTRYRRGLGCAAGTAWARLHEQRSTVLAPSDVQDKLAQAGLLTVTVEERTGEIMSSPEDDRDSLAEALGTTGIGDDRLMAYRAEQRLWAWWQREVRWLELPRHAKPRRRPAQSVLFDADRSRYPRTQTGRPDHAEALTLLRTELTAQQPIYGVAA